MYVPSLVSTIIDLFLIAQMLAYFSPVVWLKHILVIEQKDRARRRP